MKRNIGAEVAQAAHSLWLDCSPTHLSYHAGCGRCALLGGGVDCAAREMVRMEPRHRILGGLFEDRALRLDWSLRRGVHGTLRYALHHGVGTVHLRHWYRTDDDGDRALAIHPAMGRRRGMRDRYDGHDDGRGSGQSVVQGAPGPRDGSVDRK